MVTIRDVAEKAETSIATVSRVLNNLGGYSEDTKLKVLRVAEEIGYESNAVARSLIVKKTNTIGVVFPNISSMITYEFLNGIEDVASKNDYSVIVSYTYSQPDRMMKALKTLYEKRVDGIIFTSDNVKSEYLAYLEKIDIPVVFLSTESEGSNIPYVKVNDFKAAFDATHYLIDNGHHKIGMISGNPLDPIAGLPRLNGYKRALKESGIPINEHFIRYGNDFNFSDGKKGMEELLNTSSDITAVFAASDAMASGALTTALSSGLSVPEDISIMGYDDTLITEYVYPSLTALSQPLEEMGKESVKMLIQLMNGEVYVDNKILKHSITERKSVKKKKN